MQAWVDGVLRCPVIVYATMDYNRNVSENGTDLTKLVKENLWLWDDHKQTAPRMYAIDYSGYYEISDTYRGEVSVTQGYKFPRPIVLGTYQITKYGSGAVSNPPYHTWESKDVEITPNNLIGKGGIDGVGLTDKELSTFKVVRTASMYECSAYFDCFNAWDDVTISFGPCHWTLASLKYPEQQRELPAFLAYVKHAYPNTYRTFFGNFGLSPKRVWTSNDNNRPGIDEDGKKVIKGGGAAYNDNITIQAEKEDYVILCGKTGNVSEKAKENTYCKGWHWFYRFQMACRISKYLHKAMWDFTRFRIRDILEHKLVLTIKEKDKPEQKEEITIGDYITSEKGVAMLLRWHIWRPAHICNQPIAEYKDEKYIGIKDKSNYIFGILSEQIKAYSEYKSLSAEQKQEREDTILLKLKDASLTIKDKDGNPCFAGVRDIYKLVNIPQNSGITDTVYNLNLGTNKKLSSKYGSFKFQLPEPQPKMIV